MFLARLLDYFDLLIAAVFVDERCTPVRVEFDTIRVATWLGVRARMVRAAGEPRLLFEMSPLILLLFVMARWWLLGGWVGRDEQGRLGGS